MSSQGTSGARRWDTTSTAVGSDINWIGISNTQQPKLIRSLMLFIIHLHQSHAGFSLFRAMVQALHIFHMVCAPLVFLSDPSNTYACDIELVYRIVTTFTRVVSLYESVTVHTVVCTLLLGLSLASIILISRRAFALSTKDVLHGSGGVFVTLGLLFFAQLTFPPAISLMFYGIRVMITGEGTVLMLILGILAYLTQVFVVVFINTVIDSFPGFMACPGAVWSFRSNTGVVARMTLYFGAMEVFQIVDEQWAVIVVGLVMLAMVVWEIVDILYYMPFTNNSHCIARLSMLLWVCFALIFQVARGGAIDGSIVVIIEIVLVIPCTGIASFIVEWSVRYMEGVVREAMEATKTEIVRFDRIWTSRRMISTLCHGFHCMKGDLKLFERALRMHKNAFDVCYVYAKICAIYPDKRNVMERLMETLVTHSHRSIRQGLVLGLFGLMFSDDAGRQLKCCMASYNTVIDDLQMSLNMFWQEVNIGRPEKLTSLAVDANEKYMNAKALFTFLYPRYAYEKCFKEMFARFRSVVGIQCSTHDVDDFQFLPKIFLRDTFRLFRDENERGASLEIGDVVSNRVFVVNATLAQTYTEEKLAKIRHIIVWLPFYFSIVVGMMFLSDLYNVRAEMDNWWVIFYHAGDVIGQVSHLLMVATYRELEKLELPGTVIPDELTRFWNETFELTIDSLMYDIEEFHEYAVNYSRSDEMNNKLTKVYSVVEMIGTKKITIDYTLIPMVEAYVVGLNNMLSNTTMSNEEMLENLLSTLRFDNAVTIIEELMAVMLNDNHSAIIDDIDASWSFRDYSLYVFCVIVLICCIGCYLVMIRTHQSFFSMFLSLPKTVVSELIARFSDRDITNRMVMENVDSSVLTNLRRLSYRDTPGSFAGVIKLFGFYILHVVVVMFIICTTWFVIEMWIRSETLTVYNDMVNAITYVKIPYYVHMIGYATAEMLASEKLGMNTTTAAEKLFAMVNDFHDCIAIPIAGDTLNISDRLRLTDFMGLHRCDELDLECLPRCDVMLDLVTNAFLYLNAGLNSSMLETLELAVKATAHDVLDVLNDQNTAKSELLWLDFCGIWIGYPSLCVILYMVSYIYMSQIVPPADLTLCVLSSLPQRSISKGTDVLDVVTVKHYDESVPRDVVSKAEVCESISEMMILVDHDNVISYATKDLCRKCDVNITDIVQRDFLEVIEVLAPGTAQGIDFPLTKRIRVRTYMTCGKTVIATFVPTNGFTHAKSDVNFAVLFDDVTYKESLTRKVGEEQSRLKEVMYRIMPPIIADHLFDTGTLAELMWEKVTTAHFAIRGFENLSSLEDVQLLVEKIRELVTETEGASNFGRSYQRFRIMIDMFKPDVTVEEMTLDLVKFCLSFVTSLHAFIKEHQYDVGVYCVVHLTGPVVADLIEEPFPFFDIIGPQLNLPRLIGHGIPENRVILTRQAYDYLINDETFDGRFLMGVAYDEETVNKLYVVRSRDVVDRRKSSTILSDDM